MKRITGMKTGILLVSALGLGACTEMPIDLGMFGRTPAAAPTPVAAPAPVVAPVRTAPRVATVAPAPTPAPTTTTAAAATTAPATSTNGTSLTDADLKALFGEDDGGSGGWN